MKPDVKRILAKLGKEKVELSTQKVELAKKPEAVLKKLQSINAKFEKPQEAMDKAYYDYKRKRNEYVNKIQGIADSASDSADDLTSIEDAIIDLGIKPSAVKSFVQAKKLVDFIQKKGRSLRERFPSLG